MPVPAPHRRGRARLGLDHGTDTPIVVETRTDEREQESVPTATGQLIRRFAHDRPLRVIGAELSVGDFVSMTS